MGGNWTIHAWYRGEEGGWTADAGNDGEAYYQTFGGFCESIGLHATPDQWNRIKQDRSRRMHRNKKVRKDDDQFCDGMDAQDKGRCGCILTDRLKSSAKHIRNIIRRCRFLPLQDAGIQSLLRKIGLAPELDSRTGRWELAGPVYECYLQTQPPKQTYIRDLMRLCKALWSYTKDGLQLDRETCTSFTTKYVLHYAIFRTIVSEVRQFVQTYPLPETAGDEPQEAQEPEVAVVRPHVIVIRFTHMNVQMLLGGMKELM